MYAVLDANVFKGYYEEYVLEIPHSLTGSTIKIFQSSLPPSIYMDDGGMIKSEWEALIDRDWFNQWLAYNMVEGKIVLIKTYSHPELCKRVHSLGFPRSRDIWYLRTAKDVQLKHGSVKLITEDIDYYSPKNKLRFTGKARIGLIEKSKGNMAKILRRDGIIVVCVSSYVSNI